MKKICLFLILLINILLLPACVKRTPQEEIEELCRIELPEEMEVEYYYFSQQFHGDYILFVVFNLKEEPTEFLNDNEFMNNHSREIKDSFDYVVRNNMPIEKIEKYVNWKSEHLSVKLNPRGSTGVAIYFPETLMLVFAIGVR